VGNQFFLGSGVLVAVWNPQITYRAGAGTAIGNEGEIITSNNLGHLAYTVGWRGESHGGWFVGARTEVGFPEEIMIPTY